MTETDWLASRDARNLLDWLCEITGSTYGGGVEQDRLPSDRKLRLLAIAIARHGGCGSWASVGHLLHAAERLADGLPHDLGPCDLEDAQRYVAEWLVSEPDAARLVSRILGHYEPDIEDRETKPAQAAMLRDIVGNPFRSVRLDGVRRCRKCKRPFPIPWLYACQSCLPELSGFEDYYHWLTPVVRYLAQVAYEQRASDGTLDLLGLAALADAMEEAGCNQSELLAHLHSPGPHYRGMWSLDLVLGKG